MIVNAANFSNLYLGFSTLYNKGFLAAPSQWKEIAMHVPSATKAEAYGWLSSLPTMREWVGERVVNGLTTRGYVIVNRKFENTISVDRTEMEDDTYGLYAPVVEQMGADASLHPDSLIFNLLANGTTTRCFDGQNFFDTDHPVGEGQLVSVSNVQTSGTTAPMWYLLDCSKPIKPMIFQDRIPARFTSLTNENDPNVFGRDEYIYGIRARYNVGYGLWQLAFASNLPLNGDNYADARAAMQSFRADNGRPLGISPTHMVVPPALDRDARRLLVSGLTAITTTTTSGNAVSTAAVTNEWAGSAKLLMTPYLIPTP